MKAFDLEKIRQTPMFFIVGRPRTGSTLLRTLFDAHPNVTIPQEWPMLLALYRRFDLCGASCRADQAFRFTECVRH